MPQVKTRTERLEARVSPDTLLLLRRAAEMQGRSVSEFVVAAAEGAAQKAIEQAQIIRLSLDDQQRFADMLLAPPAPAPALVRARKAHEDLIGPV